MAYSRASADACIVRVTVECWTRKLGKFAWYLILSSGGTATPCTPLDYAYEHASESISVYSRRCREEVEAEKPEIQQSAYTTLDDDDNTSASAAAYDVIDVSRPVSQTSLAADRAHDDVREIPWMTSPALVHVSLRTVSETKSQQYFSLQYVIVVQHSQHLIHYAHTIRTRWDCSPLICALVVLLVIYTTSYFGWSCWYLINLRQWDKVLHGLCLFVCLFVCLLATSRKNY